MTNNISSASYNASAFAQPPKLISHPSAKQAVSTETASPPSPISPVPSSPSPPVTSDPVVTREQKRQEWSALEKASKLEREAKAKLAKAQTLASAYESKDLEQIAKAHDMSVSDYVRWINQTALSGPTKEKVSPEIQAELEVKRWKEEVDNDREMWKKEMNEAKKAAYINKNILPIIIKSPEKYEFIHDQGVDQVADIVFSFMNEHFTETEQRTGTGEELDIETLLDEMENQYLTNWNEEESAREAKRAKIKKLQSANPSLSKNDETLKSETLTDGILSATPKMIPAARARQTDIDPVDEEIMKAAAIDDNNALADRAPSNNTKKSKANDPVIKAIKNSETYEKYGTTPKNSRLSRENRLAAIAAKQEANQ